MEFAKSFPTEVNWDDDDSNALYGAAALRGGMQLLMSIYIYSVDSILWNLADFGDEPVSYVGYPSQEGNNSTFTLNDGLCITTTCADQDAAWQFVRQLFTEEYQKESYNGIPTNANLFQQQLEAAQTIEYEKDDAGMSKEQADQLVALYNSIHVCSNYDNEIYKVVSAEAAGYFAGQTALDECVKRIQNRVSLYVAEQK